MSELRTIESGLKHPNVVRYYRSFREGDQFYVLMELVEGLSLREHLASAQDKKAPWPEAKIWHVFAQVHSRSTRAVNGV